MNTLGYCRADALLKTLFGPADHSDYGVDHNNSMMYSPETIMERPVTSTTNTSIIGGGGNNKSFLSSSITSLDHVRLSPPTNFLNASTSSILLGQNHQSSMGTTITTTTTTTTTIPSTHVQESSTVFAPELLSLDNLIKSVLEDHRKHYDDNDEKNQIYVSSCTNHRNTNKNGFGTNSLISCNSYACINRPTTTNTYASSSTCNKKLSYSNDRVEEKDNIDIMSLLKRTRETASWNLSNNTNNKRKHTLLSVVLDAEIDTKENNQDDESQQENVPSEQQQQQQQDDNDPNCSDSNSSMRNRSSSSSSKQNPSHINKKARQE